MAKLIVIILLIGLLFGSAGIFYTYGTSFTKTVTIEGFEATKGASGNKYLFSDSLGNVYQVGDSLWRFHFSSSDVYFKIKKLNGKRVNIIGYGWRVPLISMYPNVVSVSERIK